MKAMYALLFAGLFNNAIATEVNPTALQTSNPTTAPAQKAVKPVTKKSILEFVKKHPLITAAGVAILGKFVHKTYNFGRSLEFATFQSHCSNILYTIPSLAALTYIAVNYKEENESQSKANSKSSFIKQHAWAIAWTMAGTMHGIDSFGKYSNLRNAIKSFQGKNVGRGLLYGINDIEPLIVKVAALHYLITQLSDDSDECAEEDSSVEANTTFSK